MPAVWNGDLVIYAHGYVAFNEPLKLPDDEMEGISVSKTVNDLGYGYATTSYRHNGFVIDDAVNDLRELREMVLLFVASNGLPAPRHIYLVGASEGALISALAIERHKDLFSGAMPASGPVGDFRKQIDYLGDFRVVFDYFFPGVLVYEEGGRLPFVVPQSEVTKWEAWYKPRIQNAVTDLASRHAVVELLRVTHAPIDPGDPGTVAKTAADILWYSVFASQDISNKLGGQPFDNTRRWYSGSDNDWRLNGGVQRIRATGSALTNIALYCQTSGDIHRPVVTMHTTLDHIVPYWHEPLYTLKVLLKGSLLQHVNIPIVRYGHGTFKVYEVLAGFAVLVLKVTAQDLIVAENVLPDAAERAEFMRLSQQNGARPKIVPQTISLKE
jgi:pimeloyl-ACP methyl ester carboxylesterase